MILTWNTNELFAQKFLEDRSHLSCQTTVRRLTVGEVFPVGSVVSMVLNIHFSELGADATVCTLWLTSKTFTWPQTMRRTALRNAATPPPYNTSCSPGSQVNYSSQNFKEKVLLLHVYNSNMCHTDYVLEKLVHNSLTWQI